MLRMTVVMTVMALRKTCFPAAIAVIATKAEPSEATKVFLYSLHPRRDSRCAHGDALCNAHGNLHAHRGNLHGNLDDLCEKSVSLGDFRAYIFMRKWCLGVANRNFLINKR